MLIKYRYKKGKSPIKEHENKIFATEIYGSVIDIMREIRCMEEHGLEVLRESVTALNSHRRF
jgi:hypothetical protein